jgi:hypothetical protein
MKPWYKMFFRSASSGLATELEKGHALGRFAHNPPRELERARIFLFESAITL